MAREKKDPSEPTVSTFSVTKGGKVEETYALFASWDLAASVDDNLKRFQHENPILASTGAWLKEMRKIFHVRFASIERHKPLIRLAHVGVPLGEWSPLLLWHLCLRELLVSDFLETWLYPRKLEGLLRVRGEGVRVYLHDLAARGLVRGPWTESTISRMASGVPSYLADFDLLQGKAAREIASFHLPDNAFVYVLHFMSEECASAQEILDDIRWRRFLLSRQEIEHELLRLHQLRRLHFEVAGSLVSLDLPCRSLDTYVEQWVERAGHRVDIPSRVAR